MVDILYEDKELLVVVKPAGMESQSSRSFEPDMVSEIKNYLNNLCTGGGEPYVGVIHRLDKPVGGVMVYAKTPKAAASLSRQVQNGQMKKRYMAAVCGKLVDNVGNYVDNLLKNGKKNYSQIVDKGTAGAKEAKLTYRALETISVKGAEGEPPAEVTLAEVELLTGRHHQIRVQFAGHGHPLWGDGKYHPKAEMWSGGRREYSGLALRSVFLSFLHPVSGERMDFRIQPEGSIFPLFSSEGQDTWPGV